MTEERLAMWSEDRLDESDMSLRFIESQCLIFFHTVIGSIIIPISVLVESYSPKCVSAILDRLERGKEVQGRRSYDPKYADLAIGLIKGKSGLQTPPTESGLHD